MVRFRIPVDLRGTLAQIRRILQDPRLMLWSLVVVLMPFYVFDSGLPQPADLLGLLLLFILIRRWNGKLRPSLARPLKSLIVFMLYVIGVNIAWSFLLLTFTLDAKEGFLVAPSFYIFNGLTFLAFLLMFQRYGELLLWLTARLVLISLLLQVALAFVVPRVVGRSIVMFNNPNQLGYYALLSASIVLLAQRRLRLSTIQIVVGLAASSYLALLSASKAALASIAGLGTLLLVSKLRTIVLMSLVFVILLFTDNPFSKAMERAQMRIENDKSMQFVDERGYDRILTHPEYCVLGAGEGAYNRFRETSMIGSHELHSSMGTLFFCYGILGTILFCIFLWRTTSGSGLRAWIIVAGVFAYGMTHQGLRFRLVWVLLGMVVALRELAIQDRLLREAGKAAP
ncbi:MAG TPA: hypothetical protein VFD36_31910 [Kofleriaceae bacterium]|nr:hypothetical protein [Kofleriaceae bacterium]